MSNYLIMGLLLIIAVVWWKNYFREKQQVSANDVSADDDDEVGVKTDDPEVWLPEFTGARLRDWWNGEVGNSIDEDTVTAALQQLTQKQCQTMIELLQYFVDDCTPSFGGIEQFVNAEDDNVLKIYYHQLQISQQYYAKTYEMEMG